MNLDAAGDVTWRQQRGPPEVATKHEAAGHSASHPGPLHRVRVRLGDHDPELNKRTGYRRKVTLERYTHPSRNSRPQRLVQDAANKFRFVPGNIVLAELDILAGR